MGNLFSTNQQKAEQLIIIDIERLTKLKVTERPNLQRTLELVQAADRNARAEEQRRCAAVIVYLICLALLVRFY